MAKKLKVKKNGFIKVRTGFFVRWDNSEQAYIVRSTAGGEPELARFTLPERCDLSRNQELELDEILDSIGDAWDEYK